MMVAVVADALLVAAAIPVALWSAYLLGLTLVAWRSAPPEPRGAPPRFDLVVPAHDEEAGIEATVRSLEAVDYPRELRRIVVVADNCTDATAERARAAGARVLVREDPARRGKGYALALAFETSLREGFADAVVVVDADTLASPNLLRAFAARLGRGERRAIQVAYRVRNPDASWRTRLMAVAFALVNELRSLARERLGCSVGLKGNGMCFSAALLRAVPYDAFSIVEDLEYGIRLGGVGVRVEYAAEAAVLGEMVSDAEGSRSQRLRWEGGRKQIARAQGLRLVGRGFATRNRLLVDLGLDLLVPPLATVAAAAVAGTALTLGAVVLLGTPLVALWIWAGCLAALALYVARGWRLSGTGLAGLAGLLHAPEYLVWKAALALAPKGAAGAWVRTRRERAGSGQRRAS